MGIRRERLRPVRAFTFVITALLIFLGTGRKMSTPKPPQPRSEIDLRSFGYQPLKRTFLSNEEYFRKLPLFKDEATRIVFTDDNTLAVFFTRSNESEASQANESEISTALQLNALFIDLSKKNLRGQQSWPTKKRRWVNDSFDSQSRILSAHDGKFLVYAEDRLRVYSPEFKLLRERPMPMIGGQEAEMWALEVTPPGDVGLLRHLREGETEDEWVDVDSLRTLYSSIGLGGIFTASARAIVEKSYDTFRIYPIGEAPHVMCSGGFCDRNSYPLFLSDAEILSCSWQGFAVLSTRGEILWSRKQNLKNNCGIIAKRSLDGSRFALQVGCQKELLFDNVQLRPRDTLMIYDRAARSLVFSLHLDDQAREQGFALSPDGTLLAVLSDTRVEVYDLPIGGKN